MSLLVCLVLTALPTSVTDTEKPGTLTYLREASNQWVPECELIPTDAKGGPGLDYRLPRGKDEKVVLTLSYNQGRVSVAEAWYEDSKGKRLISLKVAGTNGQLTEPGGIVNLVRVPERVIITLSKGTDLAPCDAYQLMRYYAGQKGKQEYSGLRLNPDPAQPREKPSKELKFSIEEVGKEKAAVAGKEMEFKRLRVKVNEAEFLIWANPTGQICKLARNGPAATPVLVLKGFEEVASKLGQ